MNEGSFAAATPLAETRWTDRERLGLLLEGARVLAELEAGGRRLADGWSEAVVTPDGRLSVPETAEGGDRVLPQERLRDLTALLFGSRDGVPGRGRARRIVRELLTGWSQALTPVPPHRAIREIRTLAPFLESPNGGPGAGADGEAGPGDDGDLLARARALYARGRFAAAIDALEALPASDRSPEDPAVEVLRLRCRLLQGELDAVVRRLRILADEELPPPVVVDLAEVAVRAAGNRHRPELARTWIDRARREAGLGDASGSGTEADPDDPATAARAAVVTAQAAWDRRDAEGVRRALEEAAALVDLDRRPEIAWKLHQTRGLAALSAGDGDAMVDALTRALTVDRRGLCRHEAGGLWSDLGVGRARAQDLAGAERAFLHAQRLLSGCDGLRQTTLALYNLAEIRLRRGRTLGVRGILRRSTEENRLSHNVRGLLHDLALWARYELVQGRPESALEHLDEALELADRREVVWHRAELCLLEARALGRLGRAGGAARALEEVSPEALAELEPEERPGLFALAGLPERALAAAAGTSFEPLWRALLERDVPPPVPAWEPLRALEPVRAARVVLDVETVRPGSAPPDERRRAAAAFRRIGASRHADALERVDAGPWRALSRYLDAARRGAEGDPAELRRMLEEAGYPEARIERRCETDAAPEVLVGGPGGPEEIAATLDDGGGSDRSAVGEAGRLVLRARQVDPALRALFALALRDLFGSGRGGGRLPRPPAPGFRGGTPRSGRGRIVGESPALLAAVERIERLAAGDLPVVILGESGTGKELAARHLHRTSLRRDGTFVAVNCAALSENLLLSDLFGHVRGAFTGAERDRAGVFETAAGGTVFLDEIGDLPAPAQGMLLRVLQEGEVRRVGESLPRRVDARLATATHRHLRRMVEEGTFREDLYYRLSVGTVTLPPLRERGDDPLRIAEHLLESIGSPDGPPVLTPAARARLLEHRWPGNVRELQNVIRLAATLAAPGPIEPGHLELPGDDPRGTDDRRNQGSYHVQVEAFRRRLIRDALEAAGGNKAEAARQLGLSRQALSYLTKELRIVV